ncbi:MAG: DnaJ domain-containing protein [Deltaproteobacteria bacterium]|nr:DnaJ domain-containing protein [Deltaproteobacteria bacterium]
MKDYYIVLGVTRGADPKKIKDAYRTVVKQYHPDLSGNLSTTEGFLEVKEAYETLSDEEKRKRYDVELAREGSAPRIKKVPDLVRERRLQFEGLERLLSRTDDFFSGFLPGFCDVEKGKIREKDLYFEAILTPREAAEGGLYPVTVPVLEICPRCSTGGIWKDVFCPVCRGYGRIWSERGFSLSIPPGVRHGTEITLCMEDIGLKNTYLNIVVHIEPDFEE